MLYQNWLKQRVGSAIYCKKNDLVTNRPIYRTLFRKLQKTNFKSSLLIPLRCDPSAANIILCQPIKSATCRSEQKGSAAGTKINYTVLMKCWSGYIKFWLCKQCLLKLVIPAALGRNDVTLQQLQYPCRNFIASIQSDIWFGCRGSVV